MESIHNLGFEVGYFHHSEDGWVYRKHRELLSLLKALDDRIEFERCYEAAKLEGKEKRRQDIAKGLSKKSGTRSESREHVTFTSPDAQVKSSDKVVSPNGVGPIKINKIVERPDAISKPDTIKKAKVLNRPKFLS
ncbi:MAG: hypothetical protein E4G94_12400 [ANME-2 cluster archaeon]|nr:MAG: hypothetical protein E4G94_12400 [ANME-2 cluster archaeon]